MRRGLTMSVGAATLGSGFAISRWRRKRSETVTGSFTNGMSYVRFGTGTKSLLWVPDPSHSGHHGLYLRMMTRVVRPFVEDGYAVFLVGRKPNLPRGWTIPGMADDYARLIADELGGKVDLVVADSGGGLIGFCLAAGHPGLFGHIAIIAAGHSMPQEARAATLASARLLSSGRRTEAAAAMVAFLFPDLRPPWVSSILASVIARVSFPAVYDPSDVLVSAEAIDAFDGREVLPSIAVPVLLVGGDRDRFVPAEVYEQTAELIRDCTFKLYQGKDHLRTISDKRLSRDVLDFVRGQRAP
jgi:pimeloyl-ACP methyl ester carboxylesterase